MIFHCSIPLLALSYCSITPFFTIPLPGGFLRTRRQGLDDLPRRVHVRQCAIVGSGCGGGTQPGPMCVVDARGDRFHFVPNRCLILHLRVVLFSAHSPLPYIQGIQVTTFLAFSKVLVEPVCGGAFLLFAERHLVPITSQYTINK